ncbi:hypothetical protein HYH02_014773 [Chlamydomonas schloesseri]|uniref:Carboxypeptidase n=1 Tax=Chlamydomonas schloesseri TaxID=2026947 RepID=A0A835SG86_9CHLO|nr:hypothetical protein HYH02_014773 [Chlamydomonas schloesseri]|eukprot:KAG2426414.1 hypothetical protein HYH02_014773 [Chlamydomonas schloesseri]
MLHRLRLPALALAFSVLGLLCCGSNGARLPARGDISKKHSGKSSDNGQLTPEAAADAILALPGFTNQQLPSRHFSGYVTVDESRGRRLFYYFVESERDPANDPVVLWLNGGPGCSSFDGFVYEQGPFLYDLIPGPGGRGAQAVSLRKNPYAWSKVANMIFLDSPAGVGLSYSEHASDYVVDDGRTAADADAFLRGWFARFPQYQSNDFYVSGESYAGIYVPNLVRQVLVGNEAGEEPVINIVGYLVGNGCTDERYDGNAHPLYAATKSLLPWAQFRQLEAECGGEYWNRTSGSTCDKLWGRLSSNLAALNIYDTLQDCFHGDDDASTASASASGRTPDALLGGAVATQEQLAAAGLLGVWPLPGGAVRPGPVMNWAHVQKRLGRLGLTPPCTDSRAADMWLNDPAVRQALHAQPLSAIGPWTLCSDKISYTRNHGSMIPIHVNNTKTHGLRALIYSGDHDMAVPHTGSEAWTSELGYPVKSPWQPWFVADRQVAGYYVEYGHGLTYATVKGAGHMVPETNPRDSLALFQRFLADTPLSGL